MKCRVHGQTFLRICCLVWPQVCKMTVESLFFSFMLERKDSKLQLLFAMA